MKSAESAKQNKRKPRFEAINQGKMNIDIVDLPQNGEKMQKVA